MKTHKKIKVLVLAGGPSNEHEVSLASGKNVFRSLDRKKYVPALHVIPKNGYPNKSVLAAVKKHKPDLVFIALHGAYGEDGKIQRLLDKINTSYTGSGVRASALAMDKLRSARKFRKFGLCVPKTGIGSLYYRDPIPVKKLPLVVKPQDAGSSVGVSIVTVPENLPAAVKKARSVSSKVLFQEYIKGREVACGVLENGKPFALPPTEIIPKDGKFFDYRSKYTKGASSEITPARVPLKVIKAIQKTALIAHKVLGCRGMSRTDMIISQKPKAKSQKQTIYVLETNTIPGMTETSLLPQGAKAAGISFPKLLDMIIGASLRGHRASTSGVDTRCLQLRQPT